MRGNPSIDAAQQIAASILLRRNIACTLKTLLHPPFGGLSPSPHGGLFFAATGTILERLRASPSARLNAGHQDAPPPQTPMRRTWSIPPLLSAVLTIFSPHATAADEEMLSRLREGGLVIVVTSAEHGSGPGNHLPPPGCPPGTRLTRAGWQDALKIGVGLRKQRVFVELAQAGPGCAARHTAYLVFGADRVRHDPGLAASCDADGAERQARRTALAARLAEQPPYTGVNLALVVDACNLHDLARPTWPECAREPGDGGLVLFDPAAPTWVIGCLATEVLRALSEQPE
jgi:hypothetical protein